MGSCVAGAFTVLGKGKLMVNSDNAVNWIILGLLIIWFVMDRCEFYWHYADDYPLEERESPAQQIVNLREFVYDSDDVNKIQLLAQIAELERTLLTEPVEKPAPRVMYAVRAIQSACCLAQGCTDQRYVETIIARATAMLKAVWETEVKANRVSPIFHEVFWDAVKARLNPELVYDTLVIYDETINPSGSNGYNVTVTVQPSRAALRYQFVLFVEL